MEDSPVPLLDRVLETLAFKQRMAVFCIAGGRRLLG